MKLGQRLTQLGKELQQVTNINNNNNNNNNNNKNNTNHCLAEQSNVERDGISSSSDFSASQNKPSVSGFKSQRKALASLGSLPPRWRSLKLDLFDNPPSDKMGPGLKLSIGVILMTGDKRNYRAALNSPPSYIMRGSDINGTESHWQTVKEQMSLHKSKDEYRATKVGKPKNKGSIANFSAIVYKEQHWMVDLILGDDVYTFIIANEPTIAQKNNNCIFTHLYGQSSTLWTTAEDEGLV